MLIPKNQFFIAIIGHRYYKYRHSPPEKGIIARYTTDTAIVSIMYVKIPTIISHTKITTYGYINIDLSYSLKNVNQKY